MKATFDHFEAQLVHAGLTDAGQSLMGILDAEITWNHPGKDIAVLEQLFDQLNINSLLFAKPAEPYNAIISYLARSSPGCIYPKDCETRTFLHDLPIATDFQTDVLARHLKQRKSVIIPDIGIITWGSVSLEQAFVSFSSVCFAAYVKFFSDYLAAVRQGRVQADQRKLFDRIAWACAPLPPFEQTLQTGPFNTEQQVVAAMDEAGKLTVSHRLVDSFFGNISYRLNDTLYISQTGSSLNHLIGNIDPCPLDGSSCAPITASSELSAHMEIVRRTPSKAILHGHPKYSVILSMDCTVDACDGGDACYRSCPHERSVLQVPIVPGEVGTGPFGLCNTVPNALDDHTAVIVYGHGLFATAREDFNDAFRNLFNIENACRREYLRLVGG